jgi:hypothetical protein
VEEEEEYQRRAGKDEKIEVGGHMREDGGQRIKAGSRRVRERGDDRSGWKDETIDDRGVIGGIIAV